MFTHLKRPDDFAHDKTAPDGSRKYYTATGAAYPSVTTVLGYKTKDVFLAWRKRVGDEVADRISRQASTRGTKIHLLCEETLDNKKVDISKLSYLDAEMWNSFKPILNRIDIFMPKRSLYIVIISALLVGLTV